MDITELLAFSEKQGASDLHLSAGLPPMIRVDGDVRRINLPPMDHKEVHALIYDIMNDKQRKIIDRIQMDRNLLFKEKAQCILGYEEREDSPKQFN